MHTKENIWNNEILEKMLQEGGVVVMPTDTIYGMVGKALSESTVSRIYTLRKRNPSKPCIILVGDMSELEKFSIKLTEEEKKKLTEYWFTQGVSEGARPTSIVLDCHDDSLAYLHRGTHTLAFRLPSPPELRALLLRTGPLVAPSANQESFPPNDTVEDVRKYFGDSVDLYIDGGKMTGNASQVIQLHKDGSVSILRK